MAPKSFCVAATTASSSSIKYAMKVRSGKRSTTTAASMLLFVSILLSPAIFSELATPTGVSVLRASAGVKKVGNAIKNTAQSVGKKIESGAKNVVQKFVQTPVGKELVQAGGHVVKAVNNVGNAVVNVVEGKQKIDQGLLTAVIGVAVNTVEAVVDLGKAGKSAIIDKDTAKAREQAGSALGNLKEGANELNEGRKEFVAGVKQVVEAKRGVEGVKDNIIDAGLGLID